jgi:uncharacterized protein Yka (UPF0111/DUF47 family)
LKEVLDVWKKSLDRTEMANRIEDAEVAADNLKALLISLRMFHFRCKRYVSEDLASAMGTLFFEEIAQVEAMQKELSALHAKADRLATVVSSEPR